MWELNGKEMTDWDEQWIHVGAANRMGLFSILVVKAARRCVLIRLWECSVLRIIVFPSLHGRSLMITTVLLLDDMAAFISCISTSSEYKPTGRKKVIFLLLCVHAWVDGWLLWDITKKCNTLIGNLQAIGVIKNVRDDLVSTLQWIHIVSTWICTKRLSYLLFFGSLTFFSFKYIFSLFLTLCHVFFLPLRQQWSHFYTTSCCAVIEQWVAITPASLWGRCPAELGNSLFIFPGNERTKGLRWKRNRRLIMVAVDCLRKQKRGTGQRRIGVITVLHHRCTIPNDNTLMCVDCVTEAVPPACMPVCLPAFTVKRKPSWFGRWFYRVIPEGKIKQLWLKSLLVQQLHLWKGENN